MFMKIVCVAPDDLSTLLFCKTLSRLLAERGDVELVTVGGPVEGQPADAYRAELRRDVVSRHVEIPMRRFISPARDLVYVFRLYRVLRRERCAAIVTFTTKPNIYGQFAALLAGVPRRIMAVRGLGRTFNSPATLRDRLLRRLMTALYRGACAAADRIWFTNEGDRDDFIAAGVCAKGKTFMTKNAVDLTDFSMDRIDTARLEALRRELGLKEGDKAVVMVARLIEQKGVREFAEAAVALRERLPTLRFLLVAPEEPANPYQVPVSYVRGMSARSNLTWLGFRKDVRELYALSDMAVLPSYYKEGGYPRALLEAMAYGKPVVAADTPECRGPVEDGGNGYLVPPRDSAALARAIEKIATTPDLALRMGRRSLERMRAEFDDQAVFRNLIDSLFRPADGH
jgi:glycosyltransferase involved in cell wall biosynthesis